MTCSACSTGLEKYLNKQSGIISSSVNLVMANASIIYDETILDQKKIENFIKKAGFKSLGIYGNKIEENTNKNEKTKFILFGVLAMILLYISMGHMVGMPIPKFLNMHHNPMNYAVTLCILTIFFLFYGIDRYY